MLEWTSFLNLGSICFWKQEAFIIASHLEVTIQIFCFFFNSNSSWARMSFLSVLRKVKYLLMFNSIYRGIRNSEWSEWIEKILIAYSCFDFELYFCSFFYIKSANFCYQIILSLTLFIEKNLNWFAIQNIAKTLMRTGLNFW